MLNYFDRTFGLSMTPAKYTELLNTGYPMHQELDLPAGDIFLRLGVHDVASDRYGATDIPLKVMSQTPAK